MFNIHLSCRKHYIIFKCTNLFNGLIKQAYTLILTESVYACFLFIFVCIHIHFIFQLKAATFVYNFINVRVCITLGGYSIFKKDFTATLSVFKNQCSFGVFNRFFYIFFRINYFSYSDINFTMAVIMNPFLVRFQSALNRTYAFSQI